MFNSFAQAQQHVEPTSEGLLYTFGYLIVIGTIYFYVISKIIKKVKE